MTPFEIEIEPAGGFETPLRGFTLFGQWCATLARHHATRLEALLEGYAIGRPFLVFGDPRPRGFLPRPTIPMHLFERSPALNSKAAKARRWVPVELLRNPIETWLDRARSDADLANDHGLPGETWRTEATRAAAHAGARGRRSIPLVWYSPAVPLVVDAVVDTSRIDLDEVRAVLSEIGWHGYGGGASRGAGKFSVGRCDLWSEAMAASVDQPSAFRLTLGPCVPLPVARAQLVNSYYRAMVHHGRHAGAERGQGLADVVKAPVLLAEPGAVLCVDLAGQQSPAPVYGRGLDASSRLSLRENDPLVVQGWAPALPIVFRDGTAKLEALAADTARRARAVDAASHAAASVEGT